MASPGSNSASQTTRVPRPSRPNFAQLHSRPLPLYTCPLPAFIPQNPLSLLRIAYAILTAYIAPPSSHPAKGTCRAYSSIATRSVHVTDSAAVRLLWECGFFGKGSLSRSEPEWLEREKRRIGLVGNKSSQTSAEITRKRREERREGKRERARLEREELEAQLRREGKLESIKITEISSAGSNAGAPDSQQNRPESPDTQDSKHADGPEPGGLEQGPTVGEKMTEIQKEPPILLNQEHLQLIPYEAFFLSYGLGVLDIFDPTSGQQLSNRDLLRLFRHTASPPPVPFHQSPPPDDPFILNYVVYHHFRSLGWVVRPGVKFSVDLLLYNRGPVFSHAEFAVLIVPDYSRNRAAGSKQLQPTFSTQDSGQWWWIHAANRVQSQVKKTLVLVYVEVPSQEELKKLEEHPDKNDVGALLQKYKVKEFVVKRWTPNRNR